MKRQAGSQGRSIWTEEENKFLVSLVQGKKELSWKEVAQHLTARFRRKKTGKQCRERYRNYENPLLDKSEWKPHEKLLFVVLHQVFGNQWSIISKYLNSRSDVIIKNYFYCQVRKTTKLMKQRRIPASFLKRADKFYFAYTILNLIRQQYLPEVSSPQLLSKCTHKERIILNLLIERRIRESEVKSYMQLMLEEFKKYNGASKLPVEIPLSLTQFTFSTREAEKLAVKNDAYNLAPLSRVVVIKVSNTGDDSNAAAPIATGNYQTLESYEHNQGQTNLPAYWNSMVCYQTGNCNSLPLGCGAVPLQGYVWGPVNYSLAADVNGGLYWGGRLTMPAVNLGSVQWIGYSESLSGRKGDIS